MSYRIVYTKSALRDVKKLDPVTKKKLGKRIKRYLQNPLHYAEKLMDSSIGDYRWRAGDYRITFDLDNQTVVVLRVRHRREVYR